VIGLPGDRIVCCDEQGRLTVNGVPLDEPYLFPLDLPSRDRFDVLVPPGRVWVMGDHRSRSADSRAHLADPGGGTVPMDKIVGRAVAIVWPLGRAGWLPIPESFERLTNGGVPGD
jgi:signal peptidase I